MDNLPFELVRLIASDLGDKDIPRFRLVCRLFATVGSEYLNINSHFFFRRHSLDCLRYIARHPVLRWNLRQILFFVDIVPAYESQEAWEYQAYATCHTNMSLGTDQLASRWLQRYKLHTTIHVSKIDDDFKASGWKIQQKIRHEQEELLEPSSTIFDELQETLAMLPNLISFSLGTDVYYFKDIMRPLFICDAKQDWYCYNSTCALESYRQVTRCLVHAALAGGRTRLTELSMYTTAFADADVPAFDISSWSDRLKHVQTLDLVSVTGRCLDCRFHDAEDWECIDDIYYNVAGQYGLLKTEVFLQQMMLSTPNLQSLSLNLPSFCAFRTTTIFLGVVWPNLNYLRLESINIDVPSFQVFLTLLANSLQELHFSWVELSATTGQSPSWIEFLKFISDNLHLSDIGVTELSAPSHRRCPPNDRSLVYRLRSRMAVNRGDLTRFLVCGLFPTSLSDLDHPDREEFASLGWHILTHSFPSS